VIVRGAGGILKAIGANDYTGWTLIEPGATFQPAEGNTGQLLSSGVTNNGIFKVVRQDTAVFIYNGNIVGTGSLIKDNNNFNFGDVTLLGTNTYSGGTIIAGGGLVIGDNINPGWGSIVGNVVFTNSAIDDTPARTLIFNRPDDYTFTGNIIGGAVPGPGVGNLGGVEHRGFGTLTLTGDNTYAGGTTINGGALVVGNGGSTGSIGTGGVVNNVTLVFNRSGSLTVGGVISGPGSLVKMGTGTVILNATNTYSGFNTLSNGTLIVNGDNAAAFTDVIAGTLGGTGAFTGSVSMAAGTTLAPGTSIGRITFLGGFTSSGNFAIEVDKSHPQRNDFIDASSIAYSGSGTLTVANLGPGLAVGDKFTLFNMAVPSGESITVTGANANWANNLATDGSITVTAVTGPPTLNVARVGNNLQFSWSGNFKLQALTNSLSVGLSGGTWADYPGGGTSGVSAPIAGSNGTVFFRLIAQ
jgi:autotransporter-associated beta strand protein